MGNEPPDAGMAARILSPETPFSRAPPFAEEDDIDGEPSTSESQGAGGGSSNGWLSFLHSRDAQLGLLSMSLLVFQGTALSLVLRFSRTTAGPQYLASVAVIFTEVAKLAICVVAQLLVCRRDAVEKGASMLAEANAHYRHILRTSWPMLVPAGLFVMQQVLVIVAASHLDAVTFQICSQSFKIMPTALFAVWLLGQLLTPMQWASLPVLAVGVVLVTMNGSAGTSSNAVAVTEADWILGLSASALSGLSSAYAGVYFEKYVKGKHSGTLWVRNLQLGIYGLPLSIAYMLLKDGSRVLEHGVMQGFGWLAWLVVALQVFGGLIVGMVVKYADNILKNFANALSVILTVVGAMPLFGQYPSIFFLFGVALVLFSVFMYGKSAQAGLGAVQACYKTVSAKNLQLLLTHSRSFSLRPGAGDDRGWWHSTLTALRRPTPDRRFRGGGLFTCARIAALALSLVVAVALVVASRHAVVQEAVKGSIQRMGQMLQGNSAGQARPESGACDAATAACIAIDILYLWAIVSLHRPAGQSASSAATRGHMPLCRATQSTYIPC